MKADPYVSPILQKKLKLLDSSAPTSPIHTQHMMEKLINNLISIQLLNQFLKPTLKVAFKA